MVFPLLTPSGSLKITSSGACYFNSPFKLCVISRKPTVESSSKTETLDLPLHAVTKSKSIIACNVLGTEQAESKRLFNTIDVKY